MVDFFSIATSSRRAVLDDDADADIAAVVPRSRRKRSRLGGDDDNDDASANPLVLTYRRGLDGTGGDQVAHRGDVSVDAFAVARCLNDRLGTRGGLSGVTSSTTSSSCKRSFASTDSQLMYARTRLSTRVTCTSFWLY
jgi:hypothetical protein